MARNEHNRKLAELMGWTHIESAGGSLIGSPPWWADNSRGQAQVPDWEADWRHAGVLMTTHNVIAMLSSDPKYGPAIEAFAPPVLRRVAVFVSEFPTIDDAYRVAVIQAVIDKLSNKVGFT